MPTPWTQEISMLVLESYLWHPLAQVASIGILWLGLNSNKHFLRCSFDSLSNKAFSPATRNQGWRLCFDSTLYDLAKFARRGYMKLKCVEFFRSLQVLSWCDMVSSYVQSARFGRGIVLRFVYFVRRFVRLMTLESQCLLLARHVFCPNIPIESLFWQMHLQGMLCLFFESLREVAEIEKLLTQVHMFIWKTETN